jgi:hypothetical protein
MLGKLVALFSWGVTLHCSTSGSQQRSMLGIKNQRAEISSLDVQRQRAMLPGNKMFRDFAGLVPGDTGSSKMFGEANR